jgi:excisionase family DNA binding protein
MKTKSPFAERKIEAVAKRLGISRSGLYRDVNEGHVKVVHFGGQRLIPKEEEERLRKVLAELRGETE